ncbi:hypothetical protein CABS01_06638, partial [Colletotrichum abscissum]
FSASLFRSPSTLPPDFDFDFDSRLPALHPLTGTAKPQLSISNSSSGYPYRPRKKHQATTESPDTHNLTSPPLFLVPPSTLDLQSGPESSGPPPASPVNSLRRIRERKNKAPQNQTSVIRLRPSRLFSLWVSPFCLPADTTPPSPSVHRLLPTVVRPDILPAQHHAADCRQLLSHSRYLTPSPKRHDQSLAPAASSTAPVAARRPLTSSPALDSGTWPPFPAPSAPKESQARPDFDELSISP